MQSVPATEVLVSKARTFTTWYFLIPAVMQVRATKGLRANEFEPPMNEAPPVKSLATAVVNVPDAFFIRFVTV